MNNKTTKSLEQGFSDPAECILGIQHAINTHDLDALTACFEADYQSEFPAHLERAFSGHAQMQSNWTQIFSNVPDIHAEIIRMAVHGETTWAEWEWQGTMVNGERFWNRGVTLQGIQNGRVVWVRLYMEPVQSANSSGGVPEELIGKVPGEKRFEKAGV